MTAIIPNTIHVEAATLLEKRIFADAQLHISLNATKCANLAKAGQFVHIQCSPTLALRRPLSIMAASPITGNIELLFRVVGKGTRLLAARHIGDTINLLGPIGTPFSLHQQFSKPLLLGGGLGIPPMVFLAEQCHKHFSPMVFMGSEIPFPFNFNTSRLPITGIDTNISSAMPRLEELMIPSRLSSQQNFKGCFNGFVTDLARNWLSNLSPQHLQQVEIFACGPKPMLQAATLLAQQYHLPCQLSLEETMACGVGGCAGCTVAIDTDNGPTMKRVCVDGPVFDGYSVHF